MPARSAPPATRPALRRPPARHWSTTPGQTGVRGESTAADLRDQHDLAVGFERGLVGVLKDLAVDRDRHPLVDLMAKAGEAPVELGDHAAHRIGLDLHLGLPAGETAGRRSGDDNLWHQPITRCPPPPPPPPPRGGGEVAAPFPQNQQPPPLAAAAAGGEPPR